MSLTLAVAQKILTVALAHARTAGFKPLSVVVLDARGAIIAAASEDGTSLKRFDVAFNKANGAIAFNIGSRRLGDMAVERPHFISSATHAVGGLIPVAGGVLIKSVEGTVIGVVGVSGDTSDNDEIAAIAGIKAAGLVADGG
ncbi:MAG: heme-binding protein [Aestuariivirga sp.]